jgi:hypothetical protein
MCLPNPPPKWRDYGFVTKSNVWVSEATFMNLAKNLGTQLAVPPPGYFR